jgi:hypothetical protein
VLFAGIGLFYATATPLKCGGLGAAFPLCLVALARNTVNDDDGCHAGLLYDKLTSLLVLCAARTWGAVFCCLCCCVAGPLPGQLGSSNATINLAGQLLSSSLAQQQTNAATATAAVRQK